MKTRRLAVDTMGEKLFIHSKSGGNLARREVFRDAMWLLKHPGIDSPHRIQSPSKRGFATLVGHRYEYSNFVTIKAAAMTSASQGSGDNAETVIELSISGCQGMVRVIADATEWGGKIRIEARGADEATALASIFEMIGASLRHKMNAESPRRWRYLV